jgi:hypothetical protein
MNDDATNEATAGQGTTGSSEEIQDKTQLRPPKTKTKVESTYSLPCSSPEVLSKILKAYVIASGQGAEAVKYSDVAAVAGLSPYTVSSNNSFLAESGFIVPERYGYYKPSPETVEFAKRSPWDEVGAQIFIRRQIDETWFGQTVRQQFQMFPTLTKSQQIRALGIKSSPPESDASKLDFLFDFLAYFEYVTSDGEGNYTLRRDETPGTAEATHLVDAMISDAMRGGSPSDVVDKYVGRQAEQPQSSVSAPHVHININIMPSTTDEELDSLVKKAKFVLDSLRRGSG